MSQRKKEKRSHRNDFYRGEEKSETRALFNPRSDNPIAFNKDNSNTTNNNNNNNNNVRKKAYTSQRQQSTTNSITTNTSKIISNEFIRNNHEQEIINHLPNRPTGGILWDPNGNDIKSKDVNQMKSSSSPRQQQQPLTKPMIKKKLISKNSIEQNNDNEHNINHFSSTQTEITSSSTIKTLTKSNNNSNNNNNQRSQIKNILNRMTLLQNQIEKVSKMANQTSYFYGIHQEPGQKISRDSIDNNMKTFQRRTPDTFQSNLTTESSSLLEKLNNHPWLNMNLNEEEDEQEDQWKSIDHYWKEKMKLHIQLANTYLEMMELDYEYAERKNLESLCWKRAIYSLVEEFRQAFRRQQSLMTLLHSIEKLMKSSSTTTGLKKKNKKQINDEDEDEEDEDEEVEDEENNNNEQDILLDHMNELEIDDTLALPVLSENGMTMLRFSDGKENDEEDENEEETMKRNLLESYRLLDKHLNKLKIWMGTFLNLSDDFYERVMVMLWKLDEPILKNERKINHDNNTMVHILSTLLHSWRRDKKWKWYKCISFRGDLSRYRYLYVDVNTYPIAWRWYTLGTWLIPATGRFYFHQSLLLNSFHYSSLYEFHKLYFGIKSLMVHRNPFLNAREGLIGLFENNRQWYSKLTFTTTSTLSINNNNNNNKRKKKNNIRFNHNDKRNNHSLLKQQQQQKKLLDTENIDFNSIITGTLIRLHGMLFTKIDLDTFAQTKRQYFDTLFPTSSSSNNNHHHHSNHSLSSSNMNGTELYWLESVILNISSLYNFNYSTSPLTKLLSINKRKWESNPRNRDDENEFDELLESLKDNILFGYAIDLLCQTAIELLSRYLKQDEFMIPTLPTFPSVTLSIQENETFLFGNNTIESSSSPLINNEEENEKEEKDSLNNIDHNSWIIYIELLLQWMVISGICTKQPMDSSCKNSLWELLIGKVFVSNHHHNDHHNNESKIIPSFWALLMTFLTTLFNRLPEEDQYQLMNWHLLEDSDAIDDDNDDKKILYWHHKYMYHLFKMGPLFSEEEQLRGVGWINDLFINKSSLQDLNQVKINNNDKDDHFIIKEDRIIRVLNYGFWLVKQMNHILEFDPVNKEFLVNTELMKDESNKEVEENRTNTEMVSILTAMDDAILFESETSQDEFILHDNQRHERLYNDIIFNKMSDDEEEEKEEMNKEDNDNEDIMGQLKKRREQLQSMINTMVEEKKHLETFGYQPLSYNNKRMKEREIKLNRLREKVIPGQTVLVFDTNCFIGHLDKIRKLFQDASWSIVIPLVVVTELDGLKGNSPPLGTIAENALELIETTLAKKPRRDHPSLKIQTSHHNFLNDISVRYEQFDFGETDKNLDDLVLSTCLWWMKKKSQLINSTSSSSAVPVCLVTGDRNLSVKARARDVQVIPVSGLIEINS